MNKNMLYIIIAALAVVAIALGVYVWREESQPEGVQIEINKDGISVQQK